MNLLEKPLPSNELAEQSVIGGILLNNSLMESASRVLVPNDFYSPINRTVFRAMKELYEQGISIDPISLTENFKSHNFDVGSIGGVAVITNLTFGVPYFQDLDSDIELVKKHSVARDSIRLFHSVTGDILQGEEDIDEILDLAEQKLLSLTNKLNTEQSGNADKGFWDLSDITPALEKQFRDYHVGIASGCPTGMKELDELLDGGGLQPGGVYLIAASEKTGKTSLALDWAYHAAVVQGLTVPIVTMEMSRLQLAKRLYSAHTGIPYYMFRPGFYDSPSDDSFSRAINGLEAFSKFPIKIADKLFGLPEIARNLRRVCEIGLKVGKPVKYGVIDYLQIMENVAQSKSNREQQVSGISRGLKQLAMELEIALVIMSSLNKENLDQGQEPSPRNLRDSGQLAFDAEALIFLHNPMFVPGKPYEPQQVTDIMMILSRQRNGPMGRIPLKFVGPYMQFMTESEYRKRFKGDGLPQSAGQAVTEDKEIDLLWGSGQENEKKDHIGPDVPWD